MKEKYSLRGLVVSLNTPFDDHGLIDFPSLERAVEMHLGEGAVGFLVPAQAAEVFELTFEERVAMMRAVRAQTRGRAVVFAGATARDAQESLRIAEHAVACGCDGVLSEPPSGVPLELAPLLGYFQTFEQAGVRLLMIQDLDWGGGGIPVPVVRELFESLAPFRCLKVEVTPAGPKYTAVLEATQGRLHVSGGWAAAQMIEALDRGVDVFMNTDFTAQSKAVMDAYFAGNRPLAIERFNALLPALAFTRQHLDLSIHFHKRNFHRRGIFTTHRLRKRGFTWDSYHERIAQDLMATL